MINKNETKRFSCFNKFYCLKTPPHLIKKNTTNAEKKNHFFANRNASVASTIVRSNTVFELACQQYITIEFNFTQEFDSNSLEIMGSRTTIWSLGCFFSVLCCAVFPHQINSQRVIIDFACGKSINFPNRAKLFDGPMKHWQSIVWMPVLKQSIYAARSVKNQVVQYFLFNNKAWAIYSLKSTPNTYTHTNPFSCAKERKKNKL